jgi:hypothetical protein
VVHDKESAKQDESNTEKVDEADTFFEENM